MSGNESNRKSTSSGANVNPSHLVDPASLTELDSSDLVDANCEGDGLADVEFKPGADFEVDDALFQGVTMKEDFLDFSLAYTDHAYCNAEIVAPERSVGRMLEVGNEEEIQDDVCLLQNVGDYAVGTDENSLTSKKRTRLEESNILDEELSEDKKKDPIVKTYNMRSKRLAAHEKGRQQNDATEDKKIQPAVKKRKVEPIEASNSEESSGEDEENEDEEADSGEEVTVQSTRRRVPPKKGTVAKGKRKGKNAKGKKPVQGKQKAKKATKADSDNEEEDEEEEEPVATKNSRKMTAKGKASLGKRKGNLRKKPEAETSEDSEEESEESENDDEEMEEVPVKGGRGNKKRKGKGARPLVKKRKVTKKAVATKASDESDSNKTSDDLPLQEVKKMNEKKAAAASRKKVKKDDTEESDEEDEEHEGDGNDAVGNIETRSKKGQVGNRDPILSAFTKSPGVLMTDDSASVCSTDDGTPGVRTSSRIKKPNRLFIVDSSSGLTVGKTAAASHKKEKVTKAKYKQETTSKAVLDISETTDTDALVIDESPVKYPAAVGIGSAGKQSLSVAAVEGEELDEENVNEEEDEGEREEEEESNKSGELPVDENSQMAGESDASQTPEVTKRSARLKMLEEATQEKFKAYRAERERTEAKNEALKKKNQEKLENEMEKEEKPKPATTKVSKDLSAKPSSLTAVKNPCRGPNCGKASLPGSVYCSDICIQNHALESIRLIEQERQKSQPQRMKVESGATPVQSKSDERIVVFERKTGKLLTGPVAPTETTLLAWLKKHPTFEVLQPSSHSPASSFTAKKDKKPEKKVPVKEPKPSISKEPAKTLVVPAASQQRDSEPLQYGGSGTTKEERVKTSMIQQQEIGAEHGKSVSIHRGFPKVPSDTAGGGSYSRGGPDPARISIRNTLRETLFARANETEDVMLSGPEIKRLALEIEQELFGYYGEVNTKYKHKYRTLITHLKDSTNKGLFRKVLFGEIKPSRLVRLSSESLGSRELAYWKDPHAKVTQEISFEAKSTKKAESTPKSPFYDPSYDYLSSIIVDTTPQHGNHFFDINCKICTGKIPEPLYYDANKASHAASVAPKEDVAQNLAIEAEPVIHGKPTKDDERASTIEFSRDPRRSKSAVTATSGTVGTLTISTSRIEEKPALLSPPSIVSPVSAQILSTDVSSGYQMGPVEPLVLWKGSIYAHDVAKVMVCAYLVSGSLSVLKEDLSDLIVISGRLPPDNVYYYLSQMKQSGTFNRDIAVVRFESGGLQDDDLYNQLFNYLNCRDRCGVVSGSSGPTVKDMYIVPVASHACLPSILLPADGPGLMDNHPNLLLGIIIKHSSRRPAVALSPAKPLPAPVPASTPTPPVSSSAKTWMYSERTETKEDLYPETKRSGTRHGTKQTEATVQKSEPVEEYTPLLPTFESKALPSSKVSSASKVAESGNASKLSSASKAAESRNASKLSSASKVAESGNAESSGASDQDDTEDWSEVARKDPIISKYSKFDKSTKTMTKKPAAVDNFDDENKPYDPFEDDDDKPYDPCSPEFVATLATATSGMVKYNPFPSAAAPAVTLPPTLSSVSSPGNSIDLTQLLRPISGLANTTDVTAAMLTTLAAISAATNVEEQRRLLSELTEKINEQQVYLDRQKEELKTKESQAGSTLSNLSSSGTVSTELGVIGSGGMLGQRGRMSSSSSDVNTLSPSGTSTFVSRSRKAQGEPSSASNKSNAEMTSLLASSQESLLMRSSQTSVLSQIPVDSSAILNLARKRLAQKAGESLPKQELAPPVSAMKSDAGLVSEKPSLATENVKQNIDAQTGKQDIAAQAQSAFSCNLSVLPLSVQQLLSGPSFENLKNIVANVTGKKTPEGIIGLFEESNKTGETAADLNVQLRPDLGINLVRLSEEEQKCTDASNNDMSMSASEGEDAKAGGKNLFASNRHGDVDYRVQSHLSLVAPQVSKGFLDVPRPPLSHVTSFGGYSGSSALEYQESRAMTVSRAHFLNRPPLGCSGPMFVGSVASELMQRPGEHGIFRPSMQALLETPNESVSKGASEIKPALLKTPEMSPASESKPNQEFLDVNRTSFARPMQCPPFPPDIPHPPYPVEMQRPRFPSDMERPPCAADGQRPQLKAELQRLPFPPQMPRPPLLPDIPQPPFPPQMPRPPFPPGMQRPPFVPEMPRPPFRPEMPRLTIPSKGPVSSGPEIQLIEESTESLHSESSSSRFSTSGLLPAPKLIDSSAKTQDDLSSPSDRYFAAKSMQQGTTPAPRTEANAADASKPFSVGDFLKQLDSSRKQLPGFTSHSAQESKDSSNKLQLPSSSDEATHRERKVLLPTPRTESAQKVSEKSHEIQSKKIDDPKSSRVPAEQKQKLQIIKKPDGTPPTIRRWSAKSDWEKTSADVASTSDNAPVIVIDDNSEKMDKDSVEMIPLPPGSSKVEKADDNDAEVEIISCDTAGTEEKSADGRRNERRSSLDRSHRSRSADRSRSRSRREQRGRSDFHSHRSDRGQQNPRSHDKLRRSRSRERSNVGQTNQRDRRKSRERTSGSYQPRSRERHSGHDQSKRPLHDQRHISPSTDSKKHEEETTLQIRERNQESHNRSSISDQSSCERSTSQSNRLPQRSILCADNPVPKPASVPSLIDMMQPPEPQPPKPNIPSLLDIMGVSRKSISTRGGGGGGGPDSKQNSRNTYSATSGAVDMKYRRDYKHGTDSEEEHGRSSFARTSEFAERNQSFLGSHGPQEFWKQKDVESKSSESRDLGIHPLGGHGDFRRPERFPFDRRDAVEEHCASAMDAGAGRSYGDPGNTFGRQLSETTGPTKRPLLDKPPERDFERPEFGRRMPSVLREGTGNREDMGPSEDVKNLPDVGYRSDERFEVGFSKREQSRRRGSVGPDGGRMPSDFHRMRQLSSQLPHELNPEKQMYGGGPGGPGSTSMMGMEVGESGGRYAHPSMLKKSLLGDYPGTMQDLKEDSPVMTGHFESQARVKELGRERNTGPDERRLGRPPLMPEPHHTAEGKLTSLMPEPYRNIEGKQTPPGWSPGMSDGGPGQPKLPNPRLPLNMQGMRPGYGSVPSQRQLQAAFGERGGFSQMGAMPRARMSQEFGRTPEQATQFSGGPESQPHWRNPVPHDRIPENRGRQFPPAETEGPPNGADSISEKKTLLPMPPMPGPRQTEMRMSPGPHQTMPSHVDGPMFMARPGMRMPTRFSSHRLMGSLEGPHMSGLRPQAPGDPRSRGPST